MKVAITAAGGEGLESAVDRSFGRARWFVVVDTESMTIKSLPNLKNLSAAQGAGIQAARMLINEGVEVVLTGNVGPNAFRALEAASMAVFQLDGAVNTVAEALKGWQSGALPQLRAPSAKGHGF